MVDALSALRSDAVELPTAEADPYASFWEQYNRIEAKISTMQYGVREISQIDEDMQGFTDSKRVETGFQEIQEKVRQVTATATTVRDDLERMRGRLDGLSEEEKGTSENRIQRNHFHVLFNSFSEAMNQFSATNSGIKRRIVDSTMNSYRIAGVEVTKEQVTEMMDTDPSQLSTNVFALRGGEQTREVVDTYNAIAERHREILAIERTANEVLELFVQFSVILHEQGQIVDNIASNISTARNYVEKGREQLVKAAEHQKKGRKCLWFMVIVGIVLLVLVVVIAVTAT